MNWFSHFLSLLSFGVLALFAPPFASSDATRLAAMDSDAAPPLTVRTYHVSPTGIDDPKRGTASAHWATVQYAVNNVEFDRDTTIIKVHAGFYDERVIIDRSPGPGKRATLIAAGDGVAEIERPIFGSVNCNLTFPSPQRTIEITGNGDRWILEGLVVHGGISVRADSVDLLEPYTFDRSLPGFGIENEAAALNVFQHIRDDGFAVNEVDSVILRNLDLSGRGVLSTGTRWLVLRDSEIHDIPCGVSGGFYGNRFTLSALIKANHVHDVGDDTDAPHWLVEGIRIGSSSSYNHIVDNLVEDITQHGITGDAWHNWNVYAHNTVRRANDGFRDQNGGYGTVYHHNSVRNVRGVAYQVSGERDRDLGLLTNTTEPPKEVTPRFHNWYCNESRLLNPRGEQADFQLNWVADSRFRDNWAPFKVEVPAGSTTRSNWRLWNNFWNGQNDQAPPIQPSTAGFESCGTEIGSPLAN